MRSTLRVAVWQAIRSTGGRTPRSSEPYSQVLTDVHGEAVGDGAIALDRDDGREVLDAQDSHQVSVTTMFSVSVLLLESVTVMPTVLAPTVPQGLTLVLSRLPAISPPTGHQARRSNR